MPRTAGGEVQHSNGSSRAGSAPAQRRGTEPQVIGLLLACAVILAAVAGVTLRGGRDEPLAPILIATGEWAPFSGERLDSYGVASAVVSAVLRQMGYEPEYRFMPWPRAEEATLANDANGGVRATFPYAFTPERADGFYYSTPIFAIELSVFYNAERHPQGGRIARPADMAGFTVVPVSGYRFPTEVEPHVGRGPEADSNVAAFRQLLESDEPLLVVEATRVAEEILRGELASHAHAIATAPLRFDSPIHLIASKRNPNNSPFIRDFDAALTALQETGGLADIEERVLEAVDAQRTVGLQPLMPGGAVEAFAAPHDGAAVLLPRGTRAVVERWSSNYLRPKASHERELMPVRILNGPQRGQRMYVDERAIVLP